MGKIHILDTEVSNKIAAGEVVERPQSVVKELIENSIDAGATRITVDIREGGIEYIRVSDNGSGMSEEDARICFLRHATSKIQTDDDLEAIFTLGFRGEALSSIGAVTKVKLYTKRREDGTGVCVSCEGGEIISSKDSGVPDGTVVEVSDLFYNTPARRKFLKKASVEGGYITDIVSRYVLVHPEISFKLIRDGKEVLFSSGDNNLINAVYAVYGKDYARNMIDVDFEHDGISVKGLIGKSNLSRANRSYESFFVNRRYVKSATMIKALEEAYKNQVMIGKFPTAILNIEVPYDLVDINVHPTKMECKFSDEQSIYHSVYHAVRSALYNLPTVPEIERQPEVTQEPEGKYDLSEKDAEALFLKRQKSAMTPPPPQFDQFAMLDFAQEHMKKRDKKSDMKVFVPEAEMSDTEEKAEDWRGYIKKQEEELTLKSPREDEDNHNDNPFVGGYFRVIGQLFDTYILVEKDDKLLMIDQHAAHERLNFEALKREVKENGVMSQIILEPIDVKLTETELERYIENKNLFNELGFECSENGTTVSLTSIPTDVSWSDAEGLFLELLEQMENLRQDIISEKKERMLYTISCKAAIKANMKVSDIEMEELVRKVFNLKNINTCPHGRPIVISMSKKEIEKDFKRIV